MERNLELVVLDMAGTTVDEKNVVYKTIRKTLKDNGYDYSLPVVLEHCAGKEKRTAIHDILTATNHEVSEESVDSLFKSFKENLKIAYDQLDVGTFDGTLDFFQKLKSHRISVALNTGYDKQTAENLIGKLNWEEGKDFDVLVTADDVDRGRPHPDMIHLAMQKTGVKNPENVAKIGDSMIDIEEGQSAQCGLSIGITTGAQDRELLERANPNYVIDSLEELFTLI